MTRRVAIVSVFCLLLASCQPVSNLTSLLAVVTSAAEIVVTATAAAGVLTPAQADVVNTYISSVGKAVRITAQEIQSGDTKFQKAVKIADAWREATITSNALASLPPRTQTLIRVVMDASAAVLQEINKELGSPTAMAARAAAATGTVSVKYKVSSSDKRALAKIAKRATALAAQKK